MGNFLCHNGFNGNSSIVDFTHFTGTIPTELALLLSFRCGYDYAVTGVVYISERERRHISFEVLNMDESLGAQLVDIAKKLRETNPKHLPSLEADVKVRFKCT